MLAIRDKNGILLKEGDYVLGERGYVPSDGYMRKGYPDKIRVVFQLYWKAEKGGFALREIGVHPDDKAAAKAYYYRIHHHQLVVGNATDDKGFYAGYRKDMVCENIELFLPTVEQAAVLGIKAPLGAQVRPFVMAA